MYLFLCSRTARVVRALACVTLLCLFQRPLSAADAAPKYDAVVAPLLKSKCVKCHGPVTKESELDLSTGAGVLRGGKEGAVIAPHDLKKSVLWRRVEANEMPPDRPLAKADKELLKAWIVAGAPGLPKPNANGPDAKHGSGEGDHAAFGRLRAVSAPVVKSNERVRSPIDRFVLKEIEERKLTPGDEADPATLLRRVTLVLTGLPPSPDDIRDFLADARPDAYERVVDRLLASPTFGERWGKFWLDAAGYADSNGYFNADSDRPLAWRYRDYVVNSFNADKPFDRFLLEQLAGDELSGFVPGKAATPEQIELLTATHYLRNGQDGTNESDGNPDEVRVDRYTALESSMHNATASILALTIGCAKCHDHKFEPLTQRDYYRLQAFFYPAFNLQRWMKPNDRYVYAALPGETERWEAETKEVTALVDRLQNELSAWVKANRPAGDALLEDAFDATDLAERWSATAPGDDAPGGTTPVNVGSDKAPGAVVKDGRLRIVEKGSPGGSWLSTKRSFDWTPDVVGASIQATFDLIDVKLEPSDTPAFRVGYYISLHDFNDNGPAPGGNLLIDGNPQTSTTLYLDNPGADSKVIGTLGVSPYVPGRNFGVRVTNAGDGKFRIEHVVDGEVEEKPVMATAADLPDGGFGFEYTLARAFVVDNVRIEKFPPADQQTDTQKAFHVERQNRRKNLDAALMRKAALSTEKPGKLAWTSDLSPEPPDVFLLERGDYGLPKEKVEPLPPEFLRNPNAPFDVRTPFEGAQSTGRRLALARWLIEPGSKPAALAARVQVNRMWQHCFGRGLVATPDNLGLSGSPPTHPELLEWLAGRFVRSWSVKRVLREIVTSDAFRRTSHATAEQIASDADNRWLARYPMRRLDAEAIRDALLAASGDLDARFGGPPVKSDRNGEGEVLVAESNAGARRRSVYMYQRRTQVLSLLQVFDAPSIVFHSADRPRSTTPLQSLALLNSAFSFARAESFARRLEREEPDETKRIDAAFLLATSRPAGEDERAAATKFLDEQSATNGGAQGATPDARRRAWGDLCQSLLASNEFLYVE